MIDNLTTEELIDATKKQAHVISNISKALSLAQKEYDELRKRLGRQLLKERYDVVVGDIVRVKDCYKEYKIQIIGVYGSPCSVQFDLSGVKVLKNGKYSKDVTMAIFADTKIVKEQR